MEIRTHPGVFSEHLTAYNHKYTAESKQIDLSLGSDGIKTVACIPAYNEAENIENIIIKSRKYVNKVIVYDDCSMDNTSELATAAGAAVIRVIKKHSY